ncbi:MAG: AI-2E family transporter, partial [Terriglobia bacterium]
IGVHYALLWGLLAFLFNFVPAIGAFISAIPAVILAYLQGGLPLFLVTIVIYVVINTAFGSFIEPKLMGQRLGLSTLVVWASLIIWGWVLGPVGMLLSVPLTMIFKIGFESYPETRWIALMLGPAPRPPQDGWIFRLWHRRRH